jgi:hypothetical protein
MTQRSDQYISSNRKELESHTSSYRNFMDQLEMGESDLSGLGQF